jgi:hypothetical protein
MHKKNPHDKHEVKVSSMGYHTYNHHHHYSYYYVYATGNFSI